MNDMISRSGLVAELEAFKMSLGDIVLRYVVDRVIDLVKNFQVKENPPAEKKKPTALVERDCRTCRHVAKNWSEEPCRGCNTSNNWENWEPGV